MTRRSRIGSRVKWLRWNMLRLTRPSQYRKSSIIVHMLMETSAHRTSSCPKSREFRSAQYGMIWTMTSAMSFYVRSSTSSSSSGHTASIQRAHYLKNPTIVMGREKMHGTSNPPPCSQTQTIQAPDTVSQPPHTPTQPITGSPTPTPSSLTSLTPTSAQIRNHTSTPKHGSCALSSQHYSTPPWTPGDARCHLTTSTRGVHKDKRSITIKIHHITGI